MEGEVGPPSPVLSTTWQLCRVGLLKNPFAADSLDALVIRGRGGRSARAQGALSAGATITGSLRQLIPDDYILAKVDRVLDLAWLPDEGADLYCADNGRPGIDPEVEVRLMLAGPLLGIVHDRKLLREAHAIVAAIANRIGSSLILKSPRRSPRQVPEDQHTRTCSRITVYSLCVA